MTFFLNSVELARGTCDTLYEPFHRILRHNSGDVLHTLGVRQLRLFPPQCLQLDVQAGSFLCGLEGYRHHVSHRV